MGNGVQDQNNRQEHKLQECPLMPHSGASNWAWQDQIIFFPTVQYKNYYFPEGFEGLNPALKKQTKTFIVNIYYYFFSRCFNLQVRKFAENILTLRPSNVDGFVSSS